MKIRIRQLCKWSLSAGEVEIGADASYEPGGYEKIILRIESQELSNRSRISEDTSRSEIEVTKSTIPNRSPRI